MPDQVMDQAWLEDLYHRLELFRGWRQRETAAAKRIGDPVKLEHAYHVEDLVSVVQAEVSIAMLICGDGVLQP